AALAALAGAGHTLRPVPADAGDAAERLDRERLLGIPAALVRPVPDAAADRRRRSPVRPPPRRARLAVLAAAGAGAGACLRRGLAPPVPGRRHAVADAAARLAEAARPHARGDPMMRLPFLAAALLIAGTLAAAPAAATDYAQADGSTLAFGGMYQGEAFSGRFPGFETRMTFDPSDLASARL